MNIKELMEKQACEKLQVVSTLRKAGFASQLLDAVEHDEFETLNECHHADMSIRKRYHDEAPHHVVPNGWERRPIHTPF